MYTIRELKEIFDEALSRENLIRNPKELYEPVEYTLSLGGKRLRPILLMMGCDMFGGNIMDAIHPAIAIEIFHNFTLVHDDIMDNAPIRRGNPTVYKKWNTNTAILSGDTMFAMAYQYMVRTRPDVLYEVLDIFTKTAIEVCEGQQYDMNYETTENTSIDEYIQMIKLKTAVLIAASLKIGALIGNAKPMDVKNMYNLGINLGVAFQLMDDLLDVYGNEAKFGKMNCNDIVTNKKTYLFLKAYELANETQRKTLDDCFRMNKYEKEEKIAKVMSVYNELDIKTTTKKAMMLYFEVAMKKIKGLTIDEIQTKELQLFAESLMIREF